MTSLKKKSITGFMWDFAGKLGLQGVGFFVTIILARILSPEDFGVLAIIMVFINLANVFQDFGFSTALVQRADVTEEHYSSVFFMNLAMGLLLATIVFFSAPFIADFYDKSVLQDLIRVMSVCFIINAFGNVTRAHLRREMDFKLMSYTSISSAIISGIIAVYMAYTGYGIWSLVIQIIVGQLLSNVFLYLGCKLHFSLRFSLQSLKELWGFSSKIFFTGLLNTIFVNLDSLFIGKTLTPTTLGYYYRARSLENFSFRYTASSFSSVLLPSLSSIQNEPERLKNTVIKLFKLISFVSFLFCGIFLVGAHELIILLFSEKWKSSIILFQILIIGAFAPQIFNLFYNVLVSQGQIKTYLKINIFNQILFILNFTFLFFGTLNNYLISFICIQIVIFYVGMFVVSNNLHLGKLLYVLSFKDILIYISSICFSFYIKNLIDFQNLYFSLLTSIIIFSGLFIGLFFIFRKDYLNLIFIEIINLFGLKKVKS